MSKQIYVLLIIIFGLVSCIKESQDFYLLDQISISPLSWSEITLGVSSTEEVLELLSRNDLVAEESVIETGKWSVFNTTIHFEISSPRNYNKTIQVDAAFLDDTVVEMGFCGDLNMQLGDAMSQVGPPQQVLTFSYERGLLLGLIDFDRGFLYWYDQGIDQKADISEESHVSCISIFDVNQAAILMEAGMMTTGYYGSDEIFAALKPWKGYGSIDELYPFVGP